MGRKVNEINLFYGLSVALQSSMNRLRLTLIILFSFSITAIAQSNSYWGAGDASQIAKVHRQSKDPNIYETEDADIQLRALEVLMSEKLIADGKINSEIKILSARESQGFSENLLYFLGVIGQVHELEIILDGKKVSAQLRVYKEKGFVAVSRSLRTELPNGNLRVQFIPLGHYSLKEVSRLN